MSCFHHTGSWKKLIPILVEDLSVNCLHPLVGNKTVATRDRTFYLFIAK
ncbi:hypothetical protein H6G33_21805 [Calothrix sp. FACHB-1219]|nr:MULTISPECIES: hypothetical protein [unclassified Calothrix]MBD2203838.1 hypothetical protein [Calothrix sp. FACHB-168]MBD2219657.1 hypothetical protein [Calothrix sp. FACHB-1219]